MILDVFIADLILKDKSFKAYDLITEISLLNVAYFINLEKTDFILVFESVENLSKPKDSNQNKLRKKESSGFSQNLNRSASVASNSLCLSPCILERRT